MSEEANSKIDAYIRRAMDKLDILYKEAGGGDNGELIALAACICSWLTNECCLDPRHIEPDVALSEGINAIGAISGAYAKHTGRHPLGLLAVLLEEVLIVSIDNEMKRSSDVEKGFEKFISINPIEEKERDLEKGES